MPEQFECRPNPALKAGALRGIESRKPRTPIEIMIDRACGITERDTHAVVALSHWIMMHCPTCGREQYARRHWTDPPGTAVVQARCPECIGVDGDEVIYFDAQKQQLTISEQEATMPYLETVDELVESLATSLGIYNQHIQLENPTDEGGSHLDTCVCRTCWCGRMERRMRTAVANERRLSTEDT